ncbi:tetratricopeptide repeat protein [Streptomyces sp. NPDC007084]|uniref:tetratricopeptide repeat protein n=1 Tax=Streptomyces sp. NPDC007084 TaxID=3154313 RepID=UPI0034570E9D
MSGRARFDGRAFGQGRVYQTPGDQHIEEHHHHYAAGSRPLLGTAASGPAAPDTVRTPLTGRVPGVVRDRAELKSLLRRSLAGPGNDAHVVHGMGGCGKTTIAYWAFTTAVSEFGRVGLWVNASERMSLRAGMLAVAGDRGATPAELAAAADGQRAAADLVWHYLDHSAQRWLLVLDNADDPALLEEGGWLRTSPPGTVLVTTRHAGSPLWRSSGATTHPLGVLPLEDAALVLRDLAPRAGSAESARKVAERLGRLPLALTLAGSHLAHQLLESWTMDEYDRKLSEESTAIVDRAAAGRTSPARQLVGRTWQLSLDALAGQGLPEATSLLRLLSCWGADPVPMTMLMPALRGEVDLGSLDPALPADRLEAALRGLLDHSLVELVDSGGARCLNAHGVLLDSVRDASDASHPAFVSAAAELLEASLPATGDESPGARAALTLLAPHAIALVRNAPGEDTARLTTVFVRRVYEAGDWAGSLGLARPVADMVRQLLGAEHPLSLGARGTLGLALFGMGRFAESEKVHREVLEARERVLGPHHPDTLDSCYGLHQALDLLDRNEEAEHFIRRAVDGRRRALGEDSPVTLNSRAVLLEALVKLRKESEFDAEAASVLADCERVLPPDHPSTLTARHLYGWGLQEFGRYEEAEPLVRRILADRRRIQGPDHPLALNALTLASMLLRRMGRIQEAVPLQEELVERRERVLGVDHPFVVMNRETLDSLRASIAAREGRG